MLEPPPDLKELLEALNKPSNQPVRFRRIIPAAEEGNQVNVTRLRGMISSTRTVSVEDMDAAISTILKAKVGPVSGSELSEMKTTGLR